MNSKDCLGAFRNLILERANICIRASNLLQVADNLYLAASEINEQFLDIDADVPDDADIDEFVVNGARQFVQTGTQIIGPEKSFQILINQHGPATVFQAVKEYIESHKEAIAYCLPDNWNIGADPEAIEVAEPLPSAQPEPV